MRSVYILIILLLCVKKIDCVLILYKQHYVGSHVLFRCNRVMQFILGVAGLLKLF